ncbi:MAG: sulfur carrier protein ThiS [Porphyromonadaceae bacterium]|nr:sulfur carrier protein ThiS [Porphyromonadaceae bacterium]
MQITLNHQSIEVSDHLTLEALLREQGLGGTHIAVAINQHIVKREVWTETMLQANDSVLIIGAIKGG